MQDLLYKLNSFASTQRIPSSEGFANSLKGKCVTNKTYKLFFIANQRVCARLGIIASKKCMGKAIERNTSKRTIRETFRAHPIKFKRLDVVVLVRRKKSSTQGGSIDSLESLFDQAEALCA